MKEEKNKGEQGTAEEAVENRIKGRSTDQQLWQPRPAEQKGPISLALVIWVSLRTKYFQGFYGFCSTLKHSSVKIP